MCEAGVTNAGPSEDNSISAVKVGEIAVAKRGLDRMQLFSDLRRLPRFVFKECLKPKRKDHYGIVQL